MAVSTRTLEIKEPNRFNTDQPVVKTITVRLMYGQISVEGLATLSDNLPLGTHVPNNQTTKGSF